MNQLAERKPQLTSGGAIAAIVPQSIEEAFRLSDAIHQAGMAPYGFDSPQKIMIAMLAGLELGLPPMAAVQSVAVINNRPCIWGDALIGVVRKSPLCLHIREWIEGDGDEMVAHCETQRKGEPQPVKMSFSVLDAKKAGLWQTQAKVTKNSKSGGTYEKDNDSPWYKYPKRMLQMRARAWCLRDVYADVTKGMQVREEVEDYQPTGPEHARDVTPKQTLAERLALARSATQEVHDEPEGFTASTVADEPHDPLTGEILPDTNTDAPAPSPVSSAADDATPSSASAEPGDVPPPSSSGSIIPAELRSHLMDFSRKAFATIEDKNLSDETKAGAIEDMLANYRDAIPEKEWGKLATIKVCLQAVFAGKRTVEQSRAFIAGDLLDCDVSEIGG